MDDGLVLNIALDEQQSTTKLNNRKKGGRWTDRLKAKKLAKRKIRPAAPLPVGTNDASVDEEQRPKKRQRTEKPSHTGPKHIVSSLFTNNPKIDTLTTNTIAPQKAAKPSNAPLADSSTFEGLGLDLLLAAHLRKMNILNPTSIQRSALPILLSTRSELSSRDVFIQSQTGSGKTLSFLLPIIQDLLPLSSLSYIDRSIGTLAVIIAPTRELAKQISDVLETLLKMRLRHENESADDAEISSTTRMTRWLVSGLLTGGATRTHEKARLRKGVPILVSTPGRLLDHLQNTSSFNVGKCRWLVLDEADRLMELGFEETITGILNGLDGRRRLGMQAMQEGKSFDVGDWDWKRRRTILCSATIREDVQKLAGKALSDPLMIKATMADEPLPKLGVSHPEDGQTSKSNFTPPSQLSQKYLIIPLKLRLVTLVALLRTLLAQSQDGAGTKIIVFFSCTDSVDFHWNLLAKAKMDESEYDSSDVDSGAENSEGEDKPAKRKESVEATCTLLPSTCIFRLHGSLSTQTRLAVLRGFSKTCKTTTKASSAVLFCTSVASRGLDLPLVRAVIQYDLPTEGGATEYVHRVGRTARAGRGGEAWCFIAPSEREWPSWVEERIRKSEEKQSNTNNQPGEGSQALISIPLQDVLKTGFGGRGQQYENRATQVQLTLEKWVLRKKENAALAQNAFLSHMRAYATHPLDEKHIFHIKHLHIGHLAKAFALRDAPTSVVSGKGNHKMSFVSRKKSKKQTGPEGQLGSKERYDSHAGNAEKKMRAVVRAQGRLSKKSGMLVSSGTSEFQIAGGDVLEKLVQGR
ncbi:hypothetical protein AX17_003970 [Amanita inopinata Kibby_2008]|nr:hypothetical protein AX17_003970 [Amanita inopinata Kibby_2008]